MLHHCKSEISKTNDIALIWHNAVGTTRKDKTKKFFEIQSSSRYSQTPVSRYKFLASRYKFLNKH